MKNLIIISGAPGSGKTTIAKILQEKLESPYVDFGWLREWHLKPDWSNTSKQEEDMAFDNLLYVLKNYIKFEYKNVLVTDLKDDKVIRIAEVFAKNNILIVSLVVDSDEELKKRVLGERDSGFKNWEEAIEWNNKLRERSAVPNEIKIDNSTNVPEDTANEIMKILSQSSANLES